jgi:hypothetical protein
MHRTPSVLFASIALGLFVTGCPEKKVEQEQPAAVESAPQKVRTRHATDDKTAEEEHGDEPEEHAADEPKDDARPRKKRPAQKAPAGEEKDQGGW